MPTQVDFYLSPQPSLRDNLALLCQLTEKIYAQSLSLIIVTEQNTLLDALDKILWTHQELSFIPHAPWPQQPNAPVILSDLSTLNEIPARQILMNLTQTRPIGEWTRIIEFIPQNDDLRAAGRLRFRHYREQGYDLRTHNL